MTGDYIEGLKAARWVIEREIARLETDREQAKRQPVPGIYGTRYPEGMRKRPVEPTKPLSQWREWA